MALNAQEPLTIRPAWRSEWFSLVMIVVGLILFFKPLALPFFETMRQAHFQYDVVLIVQVFGALLVPTYLLTACWSRYRCRYLIGPYGVESLRGIIGKDERRAEYTNISYVRVYQRPVQRLFFVGNLLIGTSATADPEVVFKRISRPGRWKQEVQDRMRHWHQGAT